MAPADLPRPAFNAYALPLPRRREGRAAALSFVAHVTIAVLVLWRGAVLFEGGGGGGSGPRGGGGGGGRPAVSWLTLPVASAPQAQDMPTVPAVSVPTAALPLIEPVKIELPPPSVVITPPVAVGTGEGTTGGAGQGPGTGGGRGTGTGTGAGADSGSGSGGDGDYIHPADVQGLIIPPDCARGNILARFWVEADGHVSRVDIDPLPKDAGCRRELFTQLRSYKFRPARTSAGVPVASVFQIRLVH